MSDERTTIAVSIDVWKRLNAAKRSPDETFNDVLERTEFKEVKEDDRTRES